MTTLRVFEPNESQGTWYCPGFDLRRSRVGVPNSAAPQVSQVIGLGLRHVGSRVRRGHGLASIGLRTRRVFRSSTWGRGELRRSQVYDMKSHGSKNGNLAPSYEYTVGSQVIDLRNRRVAFSDDGLGAPSSRRLAKADYGRRDHVPFICHKTRSGSRGGSGRLSPLLKKIRRNQCRSLRITAVRFFLGQSRRLRIGDKMAGRHGNKGIVSLIIPQRDLPFMGDGSIVDILLSPLGVPSRMNIGQLFECVHSFAAYQLKTAFRIHPFDEVFGYEASRYLVYYYLHRAAEQTQHKALFESQFPGKSIIFDGRSGQPFEQPVSAGYPYMLKLVHMVDDKIHGRYTGTYAQVTNQPLQGRKNGGGQRLGEMEMWAVEAYGPSFLLQEFLTTKSDDEKSRSLLGTSIKENKQGSLCTHIPSSFRLLLSEFKGLGLSTNLTDL